MISLSTLKVLSECVNMILELHVPLFCANFLGVTLLCSIGKLGMKNFCPSLLGELEDRKVMVGAAVVVFLHTLVNIREYILVRELYSGVSMIKILQFAIHDNDLQFLIMICNFAISLNKILEIFVILNS